MTSKEARKAQFEAWLAEFERQMAEKATEKGTNPKVKTFVCDWSKLTKR